MVWIYALSLSLPPFFNWGSYGLEAGNISCSVSWELHDPETHNDSYIGFLFIFGFFLPVTIIISSYYGIIRNLKKIKQRIGESLIDFVNSNKSLVSYIKLNIILLYRKTQC